MKKTHLSVSLAAGSLVLVALTGCSVMDGLQNEASGEFESTAELAEQWDQVAAWVPADATEIRTRYSTSSDAAILRATTASALDPALCAEIDRLSGPVFEQDWSGDAFVDNAWVCDDWTVVATDDGWYGWTPNDPDEQVQTPSALSAP